MTTSLEFTARVSMVFAGALMLNAAIYADEGMWLFTNPPRKLLKEKYNFDPTPEWLEHVQKSSVRFNSGGSGSFVSGGRPGLTKHHRGARRPPNAPQREK